MPVPQSLFAENGTIPEHTMVFVENLGNKPVTFKWERARYVVPPQQKLPIPYYAMTRRCGDPRTVDVPGGDRRKAYRSHEFQRLCVLYGIFDDHANFKARTPKLNVTTLTGEQIVTVLDDPFGELDSPEIQRQVQSQGRQRTIETLTSQMAQLQAQLAALQSGAPAATVDPRAGIESPTSVPNPSAPVPHDAATADGQTVSPTPSTSGPIKPAFAASADGVEGTDAGSDDGEWSEAVLDDEDEDSSIPIDSI